MEATLSDADGSATKPSRAETRRRWRVVAALVLGLLVLRLPAMLHSYDIDDEGLHSLVTSVWMDGGRLYTDVVERKPPLQYALYAAIFTVAGRFNMTAVHITVALWTLGTMWGLAVAARRLFGRRAGIAAAVLYGLYAAWGPYQNLALNGEISLNLPAAWALALVFGAGRSPWRPALVVAGMLMGCAFLYKQPAAVLAPALGIYLLLPSYRRARGLALPHSFVHAGLLTLGFALPVVATVVYLRSQGNLQDALYWGLRHHDMPHGPTDIIFWERMIVATAWFALACFPLLAAARAALASPSPFADWRRREAERTALILLLVAGMVGVSASGRFYLHYYLLLVPALALAAAPTVAVLWDGTAADATWPLRRRWLPGLLGATAAVFFAVQAIGLAKRHAGSDSATFVRGMSSPDDRIFVWGELPRVYVQAQRRPASRYIGTYPLTGFPYGGVISYEPAYADTSARIVPGAWDIAGRELALNRPLFIVDVESRSATPRYSMDKFPPLARLLKERYERLAELSDGVIYRRQDASRSNSY